MAQKVPFSRLRLSAPALPSRNPATGGSRRSSRSSSCSFRPAEQTSLSFSQLSLYLVDTYYVCPEPVLINIRGFSMKRHPKRAFPHRQQRIGRGDCLERLMRRKQGGKTPLWFLAATSFVLVVYGTTMICPDRLRTNPRRWFAQTGSGQILQKTPKSQNSSCFSFLTVRVPLGKRS